MGPRCHPRPDPQPHQDQVLNFMRGRTFINKFLIIDEAQNLTPKQMKTLITRAGPAPRWSAWATSQIDTPLPHGGLFGPTTVDRFWLAALGSHHRAAGERSRLADHAAGGAVMGACGPRRLNPSARSGRPGQDQLGSGSALPGARRLHCPPARHLHQLPRCQPAQMRARCPRRRTKRDVWPAHLKSSAGNIMAMDLMDLALRTEQAARRERPGRLAEPWGSNSPGRTGGHLWWEIETRLALLSLPPAGGCSQGGSEDEQRAAHWPACRAPRRRR